MIFHGLKRSSFTSIRPQLSVDGTQMNIQLSVYSACANAVETQDISKC